MRNKRAAKSAETSQSSVVKFIQTSGIFLVGNVLSKAIVFFLLPLYTAYIAPADYGYYDLTVTYITLIVGFLFFDVWTSIMRYMYDRPELADKYQVVRSGWTIFGCSTLVYTALAVVIISLTDIRYAVYVFFYGLTFNLAYLYDFTSRGFGKNREFALSGVLGTIVSVVINILLLAVFHWDVTSLYLAFIFGNLVQILYLESRVHVFRNAMHSRLDKQLTVDMFRYSLPLCLNSLAYWLLTSFSRVVVNMTLGNVGNGIFAIGSKFGLIISFVTTCFTYAWQDLSFTHTSEVGNDGAYYSKACNTYMKFLGAGAAVLIPACQVAFPILVNSSYNAAKNTIPLFLIVGLISALSTFIGNVFYAIKDTKTIFISMAASCLLNLMLNYPMSRLFGINGSNISVILSFLLNILIRNFILRRKVGFRLSPKIIGMLIVWIGLSFLLYQFGNAVENLAWFIVCLSFTAFLFRDTIKTVLGSLKNGRKSYVRH